MDKKSSFQNWINLPAEDSAQAGERLRLDSIKYYLRNKPVPKHKHTFWYHLGGLTLFCLLIQIVTGILLAFYYKPGIQDAHYSIQYIDTIVPFGSVIRSLHSWSANAMVFCVLIHIFSVFFMKAYRKPRELIWFSGVILLAITLSFGFTGYLLPWDEISFAATQVGLAEIERIPLIGSFLSHIIKGNEFIGQETLSRMYIIHILVLPAIILLLIALHIALNLILGSSKPIGMKDSKKPFPYYPNFIYREAIAWLILFAVIITLSVVIPIGLGKQFDLNNITEAPEGIHPQWYFMFVYQTLKAENFIPGFSLSFILLIGSVLWFLIPVLDRKAGRGEKSTGFTAAGIFLILYLLFTTVWAYMSVGGFSNPMSGLETPSTSSNISTGGLQREFFLGTILFMILILIFLLIIKIKEMERE